eukprot:Nitzschia sp. Nitz4//scaffold207_size38617//8469//9302//NITZ4_007673-RA/size38617-processed-gene-0.9-mRNA-1//1//CDS//3329541599//3878//frame0
MPTADELARQRIQEEANKIISETGRSRKLKQRGFIGDQAQDIHNRKTDVEVAKKVWSVKGTEGQTHGSDTIESNVATKAKQAYQASLEKQKQAVSSPTPKKGGLSNDLKGKFDKPSTTPSLFGKSGIKQPKDSAPPANNTLYSDGFAKIEKQEEKMVGTAKHITTTGIDAAGRRVTKTKIILPEQVGETKAQHQQKESGNEDKGAESNNKLLPSNWDGTYYSLSDIRQRKAPGVDKNNREQYLSPEEFQQVFKMTKEEFAKLPKWKRDNLKRDLHLF